MVRSIQDTETVRRRPGKRRWFKRPTSQSSAFLLQALLWALWPPRASLDLPRSVKGVPRVTAVILIQDVLAVPLGATFAIRRVERGIRDGAAIAVLIKPNQRGTLSEASTLVERARGRAWTPSCPRDRVSRRTTGSRISPSAGERVNSRSAPLPGPNAQQNGTGSLSWKRLDSTRRSLSRVPVCRRRPL